MSNPSKVGVVLAATVGTAFLALAGCASQGSGAATPENLPNSACAGVAAQNSCKNQAACKAKASHGKKHHSKVKAAATETTTATETSTEAK